MIVTLIRNRFIDARDAVYVDNDLLFVVQGVSLTLFHGYQTLAKKLGSEVFVLSLFHPNVKKNNYIFDNTLLSEIAKEHYQKEINQDDDLYNAEIIKTIIEKIKNPLTKKKRNKLFNFLFPAKNQ